MYAYVPTLIITNKHTGESDEFNYGIWFNDLGECTDYFLARNYELESLNHSSPEDEYYEIARLTANADGIEWRSRNTNSQVDSARMLEAARVPGPGV